LLIPDFGGWPEWMTYVGVAGVTLAWVAGVLNGKGWRFWLLIALGGWVLALGDSTPLYPFLSSVVPGLTWQRVPARMLFLAVVGMSMLAGIGLQSLLDLGQGSVEKPWLKRTAAGWLALFATLGIVGAFMAGSWGPPALRWSLILAGGIGSLGSAGVLFHSRLSSVRWLPGLLWMSLVVAELACVDGTLAVDIPLPESVTSTSLGTSHYGNDRLFSPSYSVPQNVAAENRLELADGVNPLQLTAYWDFMSGAVGFDPRQYSVTLPPFVDGNPRTQTNWALDTHRLGWLNIQRVISSYPLTAQGLDLESHDGGRYFYFNQNVAPRAWVQQGSGLELADSGSQAVIRMWSPNQIQIAANGPGRLVVSEVMYPGWGATVDGTGQDLQAAGGLLRSLVLTPGSHDIRLAFSPWPALAGAALSLAGLALAVLAWSWQ
jgi:hypothetical protein